jgi:hypothetical protein
MAEKMIQEQEKDVEMAREDSESEESENWKTSNREPYHRRIFRRHILNTPLNHWLNRQFVLWRNHSHRALSCGIRVIMILAALLMATIFFPVGIRSRRNVPPSPDALTLRYCTTFYASDFEKCLGNQ